MTQPESFRSFIRRNDDDEIFLTDTGNGHVFVSIFKDTVRYAVDVKRWFLRDDTHWVEDTDDGLRTFALTQSVLRALRTEVNEQTFEDPADLQRALRALVPFEGVRKRRAILEVAAADPRVQVEVEDFDAVRHELTTPSGVVDLRSGALRPVTASDMNSRCTAVAYDPTATSPLLDEFLTTFLPDPVDQRFVFAVLGHALYGDNARRTFPIFWGDTTSGKSQLFTALHKALGNYVCVIGSSVFRGNLDDKPRPDLVQAMFTRIAWASEASKSWALHADQVKRLTGGEPLPYRNLYAGMVNKIPRFTPMLVTNTMPRIVGADNPTKRRILVIHFDRSLTPQQEDPRKRIAFLSDQRTLEALLARVVAGARDPVIDEVPERYALATMNARGDVDHTDEFLGWMRDEGYLADAPSDTPASSCVTTAEIHAFYAYWLRKYGDRVDQADKLSLKGLNAALTEKGWESRRSGGTRWVGKLLTGQLPIWLTLGT
jgi:P4 family phage/plasmid primase-like protien